MERLKTDVEITQATVVGTLVGHACLCPPYLYCLPVRCGRSWTDVGVSEVPALGVGGELGHQQLLVSHVSVSLPSACIREGARGEEREWRRASQNGCMHEARLVLL